MAIKYRRKVLAAAIEGDYGVSGNPDASAAAILTRDFEIRPLEGEALSRDLDKAQFGNDPATMVGKHVVMTFGVELAGAGGAGDTVPGYGLLLRACGMSEVVDDTPTEESVTYETIDTGIPSLTLESIFDKRRHLIVGARGSFEISTSVRGYPIIRFTFMGLFSKPVAGTIGATDTSAFKPPIPFSASSVVASLFTNTIGLRELTVQGGQSVEFYEHSELEEIQITDREGGGSMQFEEPEVGTFDVVGAAADDTQGAFSYVHGTAAGAITEIQMPNIQLTSTTYTDQQGISQIAANYNSIPTDSDPDLRLIVR